MDVGLALLALLLFLFSAVGVAAIVIVVWMIVALTSKRTAKKDGAHLRNSVSASSVSSSFPPSSSRSSAQEELFCHDSVRTLTSGYGWVNVPARDIDGVLQTMRVMNSRHVQISSLRSVVNRHATSGERLNSIKKLNDTEPLLTVAQVSDAGSYDDDGVHVDIKTIWFDDDTVYIPPAASMRMCAVKP